MNNNIVRTMQGKLGAFAVAAILALGFALATSARASLVLQFDSQNYVAGTWTDTSGNGNNATNVTVSQQPTISGLTPGGEPALLFDGVNDRLGLTTALSSAPFTSRPNFTIVTVVKNPTTVVGGAFHNSTFLGGSVDAVDFNQQSGAGVGGSSRLYLASPGIGGVYSDFVGTNQWMIAGVTFDGATFKFYTNGVQMAQAGGTVTSFLLPITTMGLSRRTWMGMRSGGRLST